MKITIIENPRPVTTEHCNDVANAPLSASLNSGYALAVARRAGWDAAHLDFTASSSDAEVLAAKILAEDADIILFHWVYSWGHEEFLRTLLELLRLGDVTARLGAFGLFPTLAGVHLLRFAPQLDFILSGEFEETLAEFLTLFAELGEVLLLPGILLPGGSLEARPLSGDLSRLPIPDDVGANCGYDTLNIAASRGCYGVCSFCFIHRYYGCSRRRTRDLLSLEQELEARLSRRDIRSIYFVDPTFIGQGEKELERVREIGLMARRYDLPFGFETRVDSLDEAVLASLAESGATSVFLGIESGCDSVLKRLGKRITTSQIRRGVREVRKSGLELNLGFIMFEPDTTLAELEENYNFLEELELLEHHDLTANLLYHNQIVLRGSAAWERFAREGRLLLDARLQFEARYRFRDERVGWICLAMGRLTAVYFSAMNDLKRIDPAALAGCGAEINTLLKGAFRSLSLAASTMPAQVVAGVEEDYAASLRELFAPG